MPSASGLPLRSRRSLVLLGAVLPSGSSQRCCGSVSANRCHSVTLIYTKGNSSQVPLLGGLLATRGAAAQGWQREQNWAGVQPGIRAAWKRHPNPSVTMRGSGRGGRWTGTALAGVFSTKQTNIWIKLFRKMSQPSDLRAQAASVVPHMSAESSHLFPCPAQGKEKKNQTPDPPAKLDLGF